MRPRRASIDHARSARKLPALASRERHERRPAISKPNASQRGPWRIREARSGYDNPWIEVVHHDVIRPDGQDGVYGTVHYKNRAIAILPIDDQGHTWLVGQHRFPIDEYSWEIPEGGGPLDVDPLLAAQRELKEETGLSAKTWRPILTMYLSNSVSDELSISYLATELSVGEPEPEGTEQLLVKRVPFAEALQMVLDGRITDALSVATLLRAQLLLASGT